MKQENALVLDIETKTMGKKISGEVDIHRVTGMYSYPQDKKSIKTSIANIQKEVSSHRIIIGHNIKDYDRPVLERAGVDFNYKVMVDTMLIAKKRLKTLMRIEPLNFSLRNLAEELNLTTMKGDIDYSIFQKKPNEWTPEEQAEICKYTDGDIQVTKELYELFYKQFSVFRQFVSEKNQKNMSWLTCSSGCLSYKILTNFAGLPETYSNIQIPHEKVGGIVLDPTGEEFFDVWYLDFASLYPQIFMMLNLFGHPLLRPDCTDWFTGNDIFQIKGMYAKDKPHVLSLKYEYMFKERKKLSKKDVLYYAYKIILNGGYGVMRSPMFSSTYYEHTGADCCRVGQKMNKIIGEMFLKAGFKSIYGDTDSRFLKYQGNLSIPEQKKLLDKTTQELITYINANVPFPSDTFDLESETGDKPVKYLKFVKDTAGTRYLKKNYLYIYEEDGKDKLEVKGMPIIKSPATKVGKKLLKEYIKPKILKDGICNFSKPELMSAAREILKEDLSLAAVSFKVQPYKGYKLKTCIQANISRKFFGDEAGTVNLIKNKRGGEIKIVGGYYCSLEHADRFSVNDIILEKLENEIEPFITKGKSQQKSLWSV